MQYELCYIGKLENLAHEDVLIQLIKSKYLPILLYGTEVCALNKAQLRSLDFAVVCVGSLSLRVRITSHNSQVWQDSHCRSYRANKTRSTLSVR
jgi:hypothetical protein